MVLARTLSALLLVMVAAFCSGKSVRKCCPLGRVSLDHKTCAEERGNFDFLEDFDGQFNVSLRVQEVVVGRDCPGGKNRFFYNYSEAEDLFDVDYSGRLYVYLGERYFDVVDYCLDYFLGGGGNWGAFVCEDDPSVITVYSLGMIISIPFLMITLIVYCLLPSHKRNVGTKCQMAYVLSLTCAYLFLVIIQMNSLDSCKALATLCLYSFMSSFCWMNISCIDIYWTFSGKGGYSRGFNNGRSRQFYFYCLYAYGFPFALVSVIFGINALENKNFWFHPNFGDKRCWLKEGFPLLLYFYGPMGLLLICNVTLFMLTAFKIRKLNRESSMVRKDDNKKHYENDKQRFNVYFKLLIALGINWTLEFISWLVDWSLGTKKIPQIWYVTDLCNALYGVFIFYLFVCKRSIWIMLQKRYYIFMGQPQKANSLTTRASNYQTSDTEKTNIDESTINTTKV